MIGWYNGALELWHRHPAALVAALVAATGCGPLKCQVVAVDVYALDGRPKPAGRVRVSCDGKAVLEATAATVTAGAP